ncbi:MAG: cation:dicarboxylate symporter family transporter, partial [Planctomycetota bacterium]
MSVLPYVAISLVLGLARLSYREAAQLATRGGAVLLVLWAITLAVVLLMPLAFPNWESASFFSTEVLEPGQQPNLELYIPSNPFFSLTNAILPAIVLFSIALGAALIGVQNKQPLIDTLSPIVAGLTRITEFVVRLAPLGVFAISASAAGTMEVGELQSLQVYLVTYLSVWLVTTFWIVPALVTSVTPLGYRDVVWYTRDALVTAFATGSLLVVLPLLAQKSGELVERCGVKAEGSGSNSDVLVATSYTFPSAGTVLSLGFVLFAGWYSGAALRVAQYPTFAAVGLASFFGSPTVSLPFLLDQFRISSDLFQLFLISDVVISRFGTLLAAMHTLAIAILGACAMGGGLVPRWRTLGVKIAVGAVLVVALLGSVRLYFEYVVEHEYRGYDVF